MISTPPQYPQPTILTIFVSNYIYVFCTHTSLCIILVYIEYRPIFVFLANPNFPHLTLLVTLNKCILLQLMLASFNSCKKWYSKIQQSYLWTFHTGRREEWTANFSFITPKLMCSLCNSARPLFYLFARSWFICNFYIFAVRFIIKKRTCIKYSLWN